MTADEIRKLADDTTDSKVWLVLRACADVVETTKAWDGSPETDAKLGEALARLEAIAP